MNTQKNFRAIVETVLDRYRHTSLVGRWNEATLCDSEPRPLAFWIRESDDLVNIVWLMRHGVWDITYYPQDETSTFDFTRLSAITGFEVREAADASKQFGLTVTGHYIVSVHASSARGGLIWAARNEKDAAELREFVGEFSRLLLEA